MVKMTAYAGSKPSTISVGQQQCVALALAFVNRPLLFLIDQPPSSPLFPYTTLFRSTKRLSSCRWFGAGAKNSPVADGSARVKGDVVRRRKSTRLNSSHTVKSYAVLCLKKKTERRDHRSRAASVGHGKNDRLRWLKALHNQRRPATVRRLGASLRQQASSLFDRSTTLISTLSLHDALPIY